MTLAFRLVCAHWAIVRRWAKPHYPQPFELTPASTLVKSPLPSTSTWVVISLPTSSATSRTPSKQRRHFT